jgi:hypothetical protein
VRELLGVTRGSLPTAILATVIALSVAFLPLAVEKFLSRRSAKAIQIIASPDSLTDPPSGQVCRPPDSPSIRFLSDLRTIAASTDSAWNDTRGELHIPHTDSTSVTLIADEPTCRGVLSAFNTTLAGEWPARPPSSLYVAKVGNTYVGMVPGPPDGSVLVHTVVSARFEVLSKFAK